MKLAPSATLEEEVDNIAARFLGFVAQVRLYHWQTHVYARHRATDRLLKNLEPLVDRFVEVMIGRFGRRPSLDGVGERFAPRDLDDAAATEYVKEFASFLESGSKIFDPPSSDLTSIRDNLLEELNRARYAFTLS